MKTKKRMLARKTEVVIVKDCRGLSADKDATGQKAVFLGRFRDFPKAEKRYRGPRAWVANSVFRLADGSLIWGVECYWRRADEPESWFRVETPAQK